MSEYQFIAFRAIDAPLSDENLAYMRNQSSRADVTRWSFENEYHYGDFRGNAEEMLRRGYDLHLHYANFGIRKLLIRLPNGLPDAAAAKPYLTEDSFDYTKDKRGRGGILSISPFHESGELEELWDLGELVERLAPLRAEILSGDLRPFYLAHLAACCDDEHDPAETVEAPVPAGLNALTNAQLALAELYGIGEALIAAAAQDSPPAVAKPDAGNEQLTWLKGQSTTTKDAWLASLMTNPGPGVRAEVVAKFLRERGAPAWKTVNRGRTIAELREAADTVAALAARKSAEKAAQQRKKRLAKAAGNPAIVLTKTEQLVSERSTRAYEQIATMLAELREALANTDQPDLAERQAQKLKKKYPTLNVLTSQLRRQGFLRA